MKYDDMWDHDEPKRGQGGFLRRNFTLLVESFGIAGVVCMASYYAFAIWAFETVLSESLLRGLLNEPFWGLFGLIFSPIIAWWAMGDMDPAPLQAMDLLCTAPLLIGLVTFLLAALIIWSRRCKA